MRRKSIARIAVALGCAAIVAIAVAEISLRLFGFGDPPLVTVDDRIEYYLVPNRTYSRFGQTFQVNRYGMRSDDVDFRQPSAVLLGGEGAGIPADLLDVADQRVTIPMQGGIESLNAAVAAALLLYEASRQRSVRL